MESVNLFTGPIVHALFESHLPHWFFEVAAYIVGGKIYWKSMEKVPSPPGGLDNMVLAGGAVMGALIGSKVLHIFEHLNALIYMNDLVLWIGGKSIMGAFLGGTLGVELAKKLIGWSRSTGDTWVMPLGIGLAIGRIGCQISGPWDLTYGSPADLPWSWNYGDGIGRHPVSIYEIIWVSIILYIVHFKSIRKKAGAGFALFMFLYSSGRFIIEFLKPPFGLPVENTLSISTYAGLTAIQWAAILGIFWFGILFLRRIKRGMYA